MPAPDLIEELDLRIEVLLPPHRPRGSDMEANGLGVVVEGGGALSEQEVEPRDLVVSAFFRDIVARRPWLRTSGVHPAEAGRNAPDVERLTGTGEPGRDS